jgi:hypothetical protein
MANGVLTSTAGTNPSALSSGTLTTIYQVPVDTFVVASVNICNRGTGDSDIRLAISAAETPQDAEWIEYDTTVVAGGVLERSGLVIEAGKYIVAYANTASISVMAYGIETATA